MNIEVRYLSKSGNTAKVAEAIATALNVTAKPISEQVAPDTDILFLGGAVYAFEIDDELKAFIRNLDGVKAVAVFSTTAVVKSAYSHIKPLLEKKGIKVIPTDFHCRGEFKFMRKGRPNSDDLAKARQFALEVTASYN
ncbi:MAG: flavodoxin [Oscillospiraceae bacterium]|jgi:flavodoxin|nr:flavodoxin [Oscillospiraceae bacterium]